MKNDMDLKALWHKQKADEMPDIGKLYKKVDNIKRATRIRIIMQNVILLTVSALVIYVGANIFHALLTTKIGIALMVIAMLTYLFVQNRMIPVLFKTNFTISTHEYLAQLISIKRREDFLNRVMIHIYYALLCVGIGLYFVQFVHTLLSGILLYGLTLAFLLLSWFLQPRGARCRQKVLLETIARLEEVNRQLEEEEGVEG
ncbi:MAG: hypothetical protein ACTHNW_17300 [Mucilaginibacter sp.]